MTIGPAYTGLRDFLLPEGLEHTQKSYRGESGAAELLKTRIDADSDVKKQLKEILGPGKKPLGHFVHAWMEKARRLGELEDERVAELSKLDEETDHLIFGAMRLAEKHADQRGGGSGGGSTGGGAPP